MTRLGRLAFLLIPLLLAAGSAVLPSRAQEGSDARYAFADTTLLRDTLDLRFTRLFPLADSLGMTPDTLRALAIRDRLNPDRLIFLSDSMRVPVDSVGAVLLRERFNPLAAQTEGRVNTFSYNTSYTIGQTQNSWTNTSDYGFSVGSLFLRNNATIQMDRYQAGPTTSLRQTRSSSTEAGWRLSPDFSVGGRVNLSRYNTRDPGSSGFGESRNDFLFSLRSRLKPRETLKSDINFSSGLIDVSSTRQEKRGLSGDLGTRVNYAAGTWLVNDISAQVNGNFARTRAPNQLLRQNTRDLSSNVTGTLGVFESSPVGLNADYNFRRTLVETPGDSGRIQKVRTGNSGLDVKLRLRQSNDRSLNLTQTLGASDAVTAAALTSQSTRRDQGFAADGRYALLGFTFESRFSNSYATSEVPQIVATGGYGENLHARSLDGSISRSVTRQLTVRGSAGIRLTSYRYYIIGIYTTPPVSRDQFGQSWRVDGAYTISDKINSGLSLDVSRNRLINLPSASTAANNETRTYRAEWRWTYRLFRGLTATQRNSLSANYIAYNFLPENDRLSLDFGTTTTLNAVITPRLTVDVTHNGQEQPSGNYTLFPDGVYAFSPGDENLTYSLATRISYAPSQAISLSLSPTYRATDRSGILNGQLVPQRSNRTLNFSGQASLNMTVGGKGRLTGNIGRSYQSDRSTTFSAGVPQAAPRTQADFWNGSLQFSWQL